MIFFTGAIKEHRDAVVNALNDDYKDMRAGGKNQVDTLIALAAKFPYRLISPKKVSIMN